MSKSTFNLDPLLKSLTIESKSNEDSAPTVFIDSEDSFFDAVEDVSKHGRVALDAEGVDLGRTGELTIITLQGFDEEIKESPIYVVDVEVLSGDRVFSKTTPSLRPLLEDSSVTKVMFDCRSDSDALFHQFDVSLSGVLDLQVFDQAVLIHAGEAPPRNTTFFVHGVPMLSNMEKVLSCYSINAGMDKKGAPHKSDINVWKKRPLGAASVKYAANDVHVIKLLSKEMQSAGVPTSLMERVVFHSKRCEGMFRDRTTQVIFCADKGFVMEEHPIISLEDLPSDHPCKSRKKAVSYTEERWNTAVAGLRTNPHNANANYCNVLFILQHNDWYTDEGRKEIRRLAAKYPFTPNQRQKIANPPSLRREYDSDVEDDFEWQQGYYWSDY